MLQWLAGGFYLLNKVFLSFTERAHAKEKIRLERRLRITAWVTYLIGLPPWVIIFMRQHNWIAASVEASGAPAMLLGLLIAMRGRTYQPPRWLDWLARICIVLGFGYSLYDFGGLTEITQWLEIGLVTGYLVGTYRLAKHHRSGYLWFVLMHVSCGALMLIQGYLWLFWQQVLSLLFIADMYVIHRRYEKVRLRLVQNT